LVTPHPSLILLFMVPLQPSVRLFPYTTLFRSRLSAIAREYSMTVLMSNCIGIADGQRCAGQSSVWNNQGLLIDQLDDSHEGIIQDRKSTRLNSSHVKISYAVFCLKKKRERMSA